MAIYDTYTDGDDVTSVTVGNESWTRNVDEITFLSKQPSATFPMDDDRMWYRIENNQSSTCTSCIVNEHPVLLYAGLVEQQRDVSGNGSGSALSATSLNVYDDSVHMTSVNMCSSSTVALVTGVLFALFTICEILRLVESVSTHRRRRNNIISFSVHFLLALLGISDVTVCLVVVQSSCKYSMRRLSCLVLVAASGFVLPLMTSSFALQSILIGRRRRRQLSISTSGHDFRNRMSDCYPDVVLRVRRTGVMIGLAFLVHAVLAIGTDLAQELYRNDVTASQTDRVLVMLFVLQCISLCFAITFMLHYVINDIFIARSVVCRRPTALDAFPSNATTTSRRQCVTAGVMLLAAALGITCVIVRLTNVIKSATTGQDHVTCPRHPTKSADADWWILVERAVELTFAVAIETTTWRAKRRSPVPRYTINQTCSPDAESGARGVAFATKRELADGHKRLELFSPLRRISRQFKSAWWRRRSAGASRIKLDRSPTSEYSIERHLGRHLCDTVEQRRQVEHGKQFTNRHTDVHDHLQWSSWKRMRSDELKMTGPRNNRCSVAETPSSTSAAFNRQYVSVGDFDDEITETGSGRRRHRRHRPTSVLLVNDGGFIRFRRDGDPDGLPISMSSDDDYDDEDDGSCHSSHRESDYEYESKSAGITPYSSSTDYQPQQAQLRYHPSASLLWRLEQRIADRLHFRFLGIVAYCEC